MTQNERKGAGEQGEEKGKQGAVGLVCEMFQNTFQRLEDWQEKEDWGDLPLSKHETVILVAGPKTMDWRRWVWVKTKV